MLLQQLLQEGRLSPQAATVARLLSEEVDAFATKTPALKACFLGLVREGGTQERVFVRRWMVERGQEEIDRLLLVTKNL